jgi:hypothetical protein
MERGQEHRFDRGTAPLTGEFPFVERFRFTLEAVDPVDLPPYEGSALRGLLGHGLKHTVCVTRAESCDDCLLLQSCPYPAIFESPALLTSPPHRSSHLPHPFVLEVDPTQPRRQEPGSRFTFTLILVGEARRALPYLIHAVDRAGGRGLGRRHARFALVSVEQEPTLGEGQWRTAFTPPSSNIDLATATAGSPGLVPAVVELRLVTPLRLKRHGDLVTPDGFTLRELLRALRGRLWDLQVLYGRGWSGTPRTWIDDAALEVDALAVDLAWQDWTRYSSRQDVLMQLGGLVGKVWVDGRAVTDLWRLLWLGQWVHVGKATSMGLGQYRLGAAASLPEPAGGPAEPTVGSQEAGPRVGPRSARSGHLPTMTRRTDGLHRES